MTRLTKKELAEKKTLEKFLAKNRIQLEKTWKETAEIAFIELGIAKADGEPYSGAGFQNHCKRVTGTKQWGTCQNRAIKKHDDEDIFDECEEFEVEEMSKPAREKTTFDRVKEIMGSDLPEDTKEYIIKLMMQEK